MAETQLQRLIDVMEAPEGEMDLAEAALLVAKAEYPQLEVDDYLAKLHRLADTALHRLPSRPCTGDIIFTLNEYLFAHEGFGGNRRDFYDPRSSLLNHVIDLRHGTPLSLAIIYIAVGRCLGIPLQGLSFPGHFLVEFRDGDKVQILDPYSGGIVLFEEDLRGRLVRIYGEDVPPAMQKGLLEPATKRDVIMRMLRNLKRTWLHKGRPDKALWCLDFLLRLVPSETKALRQRGEIYERLEYRSAAAADYRRYLELAPWAPDVDDVKRRLRNLQHCTTSIH